MSNWLRRIWHLINRPRLERELRREMQDHRDQMRDASTFGDTHRLIEQSRDAWGWNWLDDAAQDFKLGLRSLRRSPVFAVTSTLILTLGIGLNLTMFQLANVALLRPPAVKDPSTLARFYSRAPHNRSSGVPYPVVQAIARETTILSAVLVEAKGSIPWGREQSNIEASYVSPNWFSELGYQATRGRGFDAAIDTASDAAPVVVLSHAFWEARLGSDPAIVGSTVPINNKPVTVIGVMPREFPGLDLNQPSIWLLIDQRAYFFPDSTILQDWEQQATDLYGRLKPGVSRSMAREHMRAAMGVLHREQPAHIDADEWLEPMMGSANFHPDDELFRALLVISMIGLLCSLVLVVGATNIANLVLSRATGRARELGVRIALGARRSRIMRQLIVETLPLSLTGAAGGLLVSVWAARLFASRAGLPIYLDFTPDSRAIIASVALTVLAMVAIGVLPAWKIARQELTAAIKDGGEQVSRRLDRAFVRRALVAAQVACSCLLLVVGVMMTRNLVRLLSSDLGFSFEKSAILQTALGRYGIAGAPARAYWSAVKDRVLANPETQELSLAMAPPLGGRVMENGYDSAPRLQVLTNRVEPNFFSVMEIRLLAGRTFEAGDDPDGTIIISKLLAERMYGTVDVVGQGFPKGKSTETIVGVAVDAHSIKMDALNVAEAYRPLRPDDYADVVLVVRARTDPVRLLPVMKEAATVDPRVTAAGVRLLKDDFERRLEGPRLASVLSLSIGSLTMILACLGIFGVVSYAVALRTKELGIHLALGASTRDVLAIVVRQVVTPIAAGMVIGLGAVMPIGLALARSPIQLRWNDPVAYAAVLTVFGSAALFAAALPTLKVLRNDPLRSLRHE